MDDTIDAVEIIASDSGHAHIAPRLKGWKKLADMTVKRSNSSLLNEKMISNKTRDRSMTTSKSPTARIYSIEMPLLIGL